MKYFGYGEQDFIPSEISGKKSVDIHHIFPKGMGGCSNKDNIENLIALTREEHIKAHNGEYTKEYLTEIHKKNLK